MIRSVIKVGGTLEGAVCAPGYPLSSRSHTRSLLVYRKMPPPQGTTGTEWLAIDDLEVAHSILLRL